MPYFERPGARLYYEVAGAGPPLVFAHGLGGNHMSWWQQVPAFRDRYTCVTFAHRGFAPSTEDAGGPGALAFAADLAALLDHLRLEQVRLVAQSMGGWTCLSFALAHPTRVKALVMCDTTGTLAHPEFPAIWAARPGGREQGLFERGIHPAGGERMAEEQPALHYLYWEINNLAAGVDKDALRFELGAMRETPVEALAALSMPILGMAGDEDIVIPPEAVRLLCVAVPNGRFVSVPRAGHSVYFERAAEFNRIVGGFLDEIDGPGGEA
ncbi:MAG: alpha/beta hydrolase [Dehalococcoidia bacterium]|uniref:alpha/beta fold hydrolase n=1 Tax=Candidatus Amarobacter glycogenicus TaxID=3140699 RepID=UPI0031374FC7|nr:alpha/beta hydrolase [Dehalococcoidia bacterium]